MEAQVISDVSPEYVVEIANRIHTTRLMQNYTFMPTYHLNDIVDDCENDLREIVKRIVESDWGTWSPREEGKVFRQYVQMHDDDNTEVAIALLRDHNERRTVYVYRETNPRYGIKSIQGALSCHMWDLDDDGQYYCDTIRNELLQGAQSVVEGEWCTINLRYR